MMRMKTKTTRLSAMNDTSRGADGGKAGGGVGDKGGGGAWEMRPGGMLVQKRNPDLDNSHRVPPPPTIRIRVKHGSVYHGINLSSQATFGELKKMLTGPTGLHHQDQKLIFKDKERDSNEFLDIVGVKDKSKIVLVEDSIGKEKRYLEMRRNAKMEKAAKSISNISLEVDKLAGQVSALEKVISRGGKVVENDLLNLTELLMNQLVKLDAIMADGDVELQRKMLVKRVQKNVETLDMLKTKNTKQSSNGNHIPMQQPSAIQQYQQQKYSNGQTPVPVQQQQTRYSVGHIPIKPQQQQQQQPQRHLIPGAVVITTEWETFDSVEAPPTSTSTTVSSTNSIHPKFNWDLL